MTAGAKEKREVALPEGVSLQRVGQVLLEPAGLFARAQFRSLQVDLLFTFNPLFKTVAEKFATVHSFAELNVPAATVEGLIVLKLCALPSLYRQFDMDRAALYENDITMLIAQYSPQLDPLFALAAREMEPGDQAELSKIIFECRERAKRLRQRTGQ